MREDERRLPGDGIPQQLYALIHLVERRVQRHFRGTGLHWGLRRILQQLFLRDGLSQKELSEATGSSEASISNMLKHLLAGGWVERHQDEYDYRIFRIHLAREGTALRDAIVDELTALDDAACRELGDVDAERLRQLLDRAADAFRMGAADHQAEERSLTGSPSPPGEL